MPRERVLVVDDYADAREVYAEYLKFVGYQAASGADGDAALRCALQDGCDLLVLDIAMPNRDGIAILRILRANPRTEALPVIIFSALVGATVRAEALEAGADLFLEKPCTPEELERGIRHVLDGRPARTSHAT